LKKNGERRKKFKGQWSKSVSRQIKQVVQKGLLGSASPSWEETKKSDEEGEKGSFDEKTGFGGGWVEKD